MPHSTQSTAVKLNSQNLAQLQQSNSTIQTQGYFSDRSSLKHGIVHVGVGGFHRAHLAVYVDSILSQLGLRDWAICGVDLLPFAATMRDALVPQDHLYTLIERAASGSSARVIGSITDYIFAPGNNSAVVEKMAHPDTHIVSMTITESGYYYNENTHKLEVEHPDIASDLQNAFEQAPPKTIFGYLYAALEKRRAAGLKPFTVLSCDNMQKNGHITRSMLTSFARLRDPEMADWLATNGAFPNSMVDRITPRTLSTDIDDLASQFGIEDAWPVVTEPFSQWVIEDKFADGRPPFEQVGVQVVPDVKDVEQYEMVKLRLLNGSHVAMAYAGYLAGFTYVHEVIQDPTFGKYIWEMMQEEVKPLLPQHLPDVDLDAYCKKLVERFANPTLKDEVTRICLGGSGKMPQFIMPSIAEQIMAGGPLRRLTLCAAAWFRYLNGLDEQGRDFKIDDPMAEEMRALAREGGDKPAKLLSVKSLFGDDLRDDKRFIDQLTRDMESFYTEGAMATLRKCVGSP